MTYARVAALFAGLMVLSGFSAPASLMAQEQESYGAIRDFLVAHTNVVELTGEQGQRVAICPEYQGRVMTSTTSDLNGRSLGWVNKSFIEAGVRDPHFSNYGGEDRLWLGPEGGPFSLWFAPGAEQKLTNWLTPPALNDGAFKIVSDKEEPYYRLSRQMKFTNAAKTSFDLDVVREIRYQAPHQFGKIFGSETLAALTTAKLRMVGFQTINTITNRGPAMTRDKGLVAIWSLGQFPAGPQTHIIIPYRGGEISDLGPIVNADYFGVIPADRLRVGAEAIWFLGDGKFRSKVGVSQARARPAVASIDMERGLLTLVHFSMPKDPKEFGYVNNSWGRQEEPYRGDVVNSYNDGPPEPGRPALGGFYEIESLSPAAQLPTGKSITHTQTTFHIEGDAASLARIARAALGVDIKLQETASEKSKR
jgi:hypothetical protein